MDNFGLRINLKKEPMDEKASGEMFNEIMQIIEKYKLLNDLNYIEIFRIEMEPIKGVDA